MAVVAPFTGAWIETTEKPLWPQKPESLPSRERGLKRQGTPQQKADLLVAPFTGAWIETA